MSEWKRYKLGELLSIKHGWAFKSENYVKDGKTALVTLRNISEDSRFVFDVNKTTYYGGEYPEEYNLNEGDLIIPLTEQVVGLLGNSAFVPNFGDIKFVLNQRVGKVQEKYEKIDKIFLKYLLSTTTVRTQMEYRASGTKQRNISPKDIYDIEVYIPELVIQKYIGRILYNLDKKIQINNQINQELEAMAKTLYDYWFVQFDFPDQNGKPYKSSGGKMVYHPELKREIPEGWGVESVGNLLDKVTKAEKIENNSIEFIGEIPVIDQSQKYIAGFTNNEKALLQPQDGHVIFGDHTRVVKYINFDYARGADGTQVLISNNENISNVLLYHMIEDFDLSNYGYARHFKFLKEKTVIVPDKEVSSKFETQANVIYEKIKNNIFENQELTQLRDWLLPMLMNGQVKVE